MRVPSSPKKKKYPIFFERVRNMKIHSDVITEADLKEAAQIRGMRGVEIAITREGSRSRKTGWDVKLYGSSSYASQSDRSRKAATWDEWGIVINYLFEVDPEAIIGKYSSASKFHEYTWFRFAELDWKDQHKSHTWNFGGKWPYCECGAELHTAALA